MDRTPLFVSANSASLADQDYENDQDEDGENDEDGQDGNDGDDIPLCVVESKCVQVSGGRATAPKQARAC